MRFYQFILFHFVSTYILGQNLVVNGNIEIDSCRPYWRTEEIKGWERHNTADHIHYSCSYINERTKYWIPFKGRGAIGLYTGGYDIVNQDTFYAREYAIASLSDTLKQGQSYSVSYWVKPSAYADNIWNYMTSDQISLVFRQDSLQFRTRDENGNYIEFLFFDPDIVNHDGILYNYQEYKQIESCYEATGKETGFMLGNFLELGATKLDTLRNDRENASQSELSWFSNKSYVLVDNVEVIHVPDIAINDTIICIGDSLSLRKDSLGYDRWYLDGIEKDNITIKQEGDYTITAYRGTCIKDKIFRVDLRSCSDCQFYVPNVISRSNQSPNNQVSISSNCNYEIKSASIYDRWGNVVYQSSNLFNWDGRSENKSVVTGVYVFMIEVSIDNSTTDRESKIISGSITIVN